MDSAGRNIHAQLNMLEKAIELGVVAVEPKRLIDELHPFAVSGEMRAIIQKTGDEQTDKQEILRNLNDFSAVVKNIITMYKDLLSRSCSAECD